MARQEIILGTPPAGLGGDPPRTASMKINVMTQELYDKNAALKSAAFADVVGAVAGGAVIERGSNASGSFVRFADGTMFTWGSRFVINVKTAAGGAINSEVTSKQPAVFVGDAQHSVNITFYTGVDGGGLPLYGSMQYYTSIGSPVMQYIAVNTGQTPFYVNPSFTIGIIEANSHYITYQSSGRWK